MTKKKKHSLKVVDIQKLGITELKCSKGGGVRPLSDFRIHKGYYMSYCKDKEREDNRNRSQSRIWKEIKLNNGNTISAKITRMRPSIKVYSANTDKCLYFKKTSKISEAIEAFKIYSGVQTNISHEIR